MSNKVFGTLSREEISTIKQFENIIQSFDFSDYEKDFLEDFGRHMVNLWKAQRRTSRRITIVNEIDPTIWGKACDIYKERFNSNPEGETNE
jgi:hypothetical protein